MRPGFDEAGGRGGRRQEEIGALPLADGSTRFRVWAPRARKVAVLFEDGCRPPVPLAAEEYGYFSAAVPGVGHGDLYRYRLDNAGSYPDPASRSQPRGVHGPSQVINPERFSWHDREWRGIPLERYIIYELHVGAFTPQGTFDGVIPHLDYLAELGVTALELMPVAQFPGERNWGYDGTFPCAPQNSYGGPDGLKRLVDACHGRGMALVLDVVYNHLGPEGNYLHPFGPYFTDRYRTPWGDAFNFDGPDSDPVRDYVIASALRWVEEYHVDALRLDAVHGIVDCGARHILEELSDELHRCRHTLGRPVHLIAESDLNDVRVILPPERGGHGVDAQWNDDFHHALTALLTGERSGYYADFGSFAHLVAAFQQGFVLNGGYSVFRRRRHGSSAAGCTPFRLVVFSQNHDQVGNRMAGDRPQARLDAARLRLAAAAVLLSPCLPLLFMGEEYADPAPFPYFVSHGDPDLVAAVREGRRREFAPFLHQGEMPDPQDEATFNSARLELGLHRVGEHARLFAFYRGLIRLRTELLPVSRFQGGEMELAADQERRLLRIVRQATWGSLLCLLNFSPDRHILELPPGQWRPLPAPLSAGRLWREGEVTRVTVPPHGVALFGKG